MSDDRPPKFVSVKEFAERHSISEWLVEQACKTNELPHARLGKRILIPETDRKGEGRNTSGPQSIVNPQEF